MGYGLDYLEGLIPSSLNQNPKHQYFMGNQSPPTSSFEATPPVEQVPPSINDIGTRFDRFEQHQDGLEQCQGQILIELQ